MERDLFAVGGDVKQQMICTVKELAGVFGVSEVSISKWKKAGMPLVSRGRYDLGACVQWRMAELLDKAGPHNKDGSDERAELIKAQTEKTKLESAKLAGELVAVSDMQHTLNQVAVIISSQLDGLGARVSGVVADMTQPGEIQGIIFDECRSIRGAISEAVRESADRTIAENDGGDRKTTTKKKRRTVGRSKPRATTRKSRARKVAKQPDTVCNTDNGGIQ